VDAAVDCAKRLHDVIGGARADEIAEVVVRTSMYTMAVDQRVAAYLDGARTPVSALVFCAPYAVAATLLNGDLAADDFALPAVGDDERWRLAGKVRMEHDEDMTRESLLCEVPFGEALRQAGPRAATWLEEVGTQWLVDLVGELPPPSESFETARKATPAQVTVRLRGGAEHTFEQRIPVGAIGPDTRARHAELVREKYLSTGGGEKAADLAAALPEASAADVRVMLEEALASD
jgi:2-methylcitrate dehydratase PrpD